MTHRGEPEFHDRTADRLLSQYGGDLAARLDDALDVEAGLREALLQVRHDAAVDRLGWVLDVEAGLRAVLPPLPPSSHTSTRSARRGDDNRFAWPVGASDRLSLRTNPHVATAYRALTRDIVVDGEYLTGDDARDLDLDLVRALAHDLDHAFTLGVDAERDRGGDFRRGLERVRSLNLALRLDLERGTGRNHNGNRDHPHAIARDLDRVRAMIRVLDRIRARSRRQGASLGLLLDRAHSRARDLELALGRAGSDRVLTSTIVNIRVHEVARAIGMVLDRVAPALDLDSVHAFINDFTTADLRAVDLDGLDLAGVRWSETGTRWPAAVDVEELKSRSEETPPCSGIWVVRSGTATVRGLPVDMGS
ncbi:hypothetical protein [Streptomyces naganishii]|uniref:Uncharacterized protein n=1 Tax=Streptomyces naganishii JCM 4654 TaxID=1306179 RepID=A0A919CZB1_9ACTN|nr:hypothetical protein [Streptomyces naganishii]GHD96061.1 hypothetical protein GCM10010508_63320 [Streptomyces naganishii JCM 4654]